MPRPEQRGGGWEEEEEEEEEQEEQEEQEQEVLTPTPPCPQFARDSKCCWRVEAKRFRDAR